MDDLQLSPTLANKLVWGALLVVAYMVKRYQNKVDVLQAAQHQFVTREELGRELGLMREATLQQHKENREWLQSISEGMTTIHRRIDTAFEKK